MIREKFGPFLLKFYNPKIWHYLEMNRKLFDEPAALQDYQNMRLEKLLFHAYENTEYYREIFDNVYLIRDGKINWDRFSNVPLLTKEIIRNNHEKLQAKNIHSRNTFKNSSGGSTGEPVKFIQDKDYYERMVADTLFFAEMYGKNVGDKEIKIWGSEEDFYKEKKNVKNQIVNYFFNRIILNSFQLDGDLIHKYLEVVNEVKPKMIWTYVDSIFEIAKYIARNNFVDIYQPGIIVCTAGTLYPEMLEVIQNAFPESEILNQYGSREVGIIGIGGEEINIFRQSIYMELFDKQDKKYIKDAGTGNIIVTSLNNYAMPLIKFDIGDIGDSKTVNGTNVSSLTKLNGRENSHIVKRSGSLIHGELFTHLFYFVDEIKKFQVIQEDFEKFTVNIQPNNLSINDTIIKNIHAKFDQIMETPCEINFNILTDLPKLKSGKYQFVFSKVRHD